MRRKIHAGADENANALLLFTPETPRPATTPAAVVAAPPLKVVAPLDAYPPFPRRSLSGPIFAVVLTVVGGALVIGIAGGYTNAELPWSLAMQWSDAVAPPAAAVSTPAAAATPEPPVQPTSPDRQPTSPLPGSAASIPESSQGLQDPAVPPVVVPAPVTAAPAALSDAAGTGSLDISSYPAGAVVSLDGRIVGQTPLLLRNVPPGPHVVGIEAPGFSRWATSLDVGVGDRTRLTAPLSRH